MAGSRATMSEHSVGDELTESAVQQFRETIYDYFRHHGRDFPWRRTDDPYAIFVSEIMLQQTQTDRVVAKFESFISRFGDFGSLAKAPLVEVLAEWQGLGYNRRAVALQKSARIVVHQHGGRLPDDPEILVSFPGVGVATAASIAAFGFNRPTVFIETNIRTVFIYHFFGERTAVGDDEIRPLVARTLDREQARRWYSALMDYGAYLKPVHRGLTGRSKHHHRQAAFEGSNRQVRGQILKLLVAEPGLSKEQVVIRLGLQADRVERGLSQLRAEGFIDMSESGHYAIRR